jgi:hypothetical protein
MRNHRAVLVALLIGVAPVIAGCSSGFDLDNLDVLGLNQKKKLPGERHALFPEGVPGVQQGIPAEYMKGSNVAQQPGAAVPIEPLKLDQAQTAAAEPAAEDKPKPKPKPHKRVAAKPKPTPTRVNVSPPQQQPQAASPWPSAPPPQQQQPAQQAASPWPQQQQQAPAPWPSAPPPGTFSKQ